MKDLKKMSREDLKAFINSFDTIISDINGVLFYLEPIQGAKEGLKVLINLGKSIHYVSNNTSLTMNVHKKIFKLLDIELADNDLIQPTMVVIDYLKSINFNQRLYCIVNEPAVEMLSNAGIRVATEEVSPVETHDEFLQKIQDDDSIGAVFVDVDPNVNYVKLCKAVSILERSDVKLLFGATDRSVMLSSEKCVIGPAMFQNIIEQNSEQVPIMLGKPSEHLKNMVFERYGIKDPKRVLMIGDMLDQDMLFGSMCGFQKLLVYSGVIKPKDVVDISDPKLKPDYCVDSMGDLGELLEPFVNEMITRNVM